MNRLFILWLFCASWAQAGVIYDFQGAFAPNQWSLTPDQGTVAFNGTSPPNTLTLTGPTGNFFNSYDEASFTAGSVASGGTGWILNFHWVFQAGDAGGTVELISGYLADPASMTTTVLDPGGVSTSSPIAGESIYLEPSETVEFLLISDPTSAGKSAPDFVVNEFVAAVPEPNTAPWILAVLTLPIFGGPLLKVFRRKLSG